MQERAFGGLDRESPTFLWSAPAEWSRWNVSLKLAVAPAEPAESRRPNDHISIFDEGRGVLADWASLKAGDPYTDRMRFVFTMVLVMFMFVGL